jgi:cation-transporting ATPase 13A1
MNNTESLLFIACMLVFAVIASGYVLVHGLADESRSRYKLMLNCVMILTSVVPPELPMELSLAVTTSIINLAKENIFCTEPFRIPFAGATDTCCFDKTGTLTSDDFVVLGLAGLDPDSKENLRNLKDVPLDSKLVIAGCHSLSFIESEIIGDSLEKVSFEAIDWSYSRSEVAQSRPAAEHKVRILHRYPFSSVLKRMTCLVLPEHEKAPVLHAVTKGAAEVTAFEVSCLLCDCRLPALWMLLA